MRSELLQEFVEFLPRFFDDFLLVALSILDRLHLALELRGQLLAHDLGAVLEEGVDYLDSQVGDGDLVAEDVAPCVDVL